MVKRILAVLVISLVVCSVASADILGTAVNYVKERPAKTGVSYDFDSRDLLASVGTALVQDVYIPNLDIDLLVSANAEEIFEDDSNIVSIGPSYNIVFTENTSISVGVSAGIQRFENFEDGNTGEAKLLANVFLKHRF